MECTHPRDWLGPQRDAVSVSSAEKILMENNHFCTALNSPRSPFEAFYFVKLRLVLGYDYTATEEILLLLRNVEH